MIATSSYVNVVKNKSTLLFLVLAGIFLTNAIITQFMGVKIFSLERTFGAEPFSFSMLGQDNLAFNLSAGVLLWPIIFVLTDVINEYFGQRGVRFLSYLAVILIAYSFLGYYFAINLPPADFWPSSHYDGLESLEQEAIRAKVGDYDYAYRIVFGQGLWIICGSLAAFLIGQIVDVMVFHQIKKWTGENYIWLRATGSTLVSQFIDSFVVLFIAFYLGAGWTMGTVIALGLVAYSYKFLVAIFMTPIIYFAHFAIDRYLGEDLANKMKLEATIKKR